MIGSLAIDVTMFHLSVSKESVSYLRDGLFVQLSQVKGLHFCTSPTNWCSCLEGGDGWGRFTACGHLGFIYKLLHTFQTSFLLDIVKD